MKSFSVNVVYQSPYINIHYKVFLGGMESISKGNMDMFSHNTRLANTKEGIICSAEVSNNTGRIEQMGVRLAYGAIWPLVQRTDLIVLC